MRVAIITFHCSLNYGSALQAYALQSAVEKTGHDATIIDYRSADYDQYKLLRLARPRTMLGLLRAYSTKKQRSVAFRAFWKAYLKLTDRTFSYKHEQELMEIGDEYDCYICGSDQIWNLDCTHGVIGPFFLSFVDNKRKAAYAPSLAHIAFKPENFDKQLVARYLSSFDFISVREAATVPTFQSLVNTRIIVAPDPTFALCKNEFKKIAASPSLREPYIFVYLLRDCPEVLIEAESLAERNSLPILYCCDRKLRIPNAQWVSSAGPSEFLGLIENAKYVVSNSFHASVFSSIFEKDFVTYATDNSASRITEFLHYLTLDDRCLISSDHKKPEPINWEIVRTRLAGMRNKSLEILRYAIEG